MNDSLIKKEKPTVKNYNKSNLIYNSLSFCRYSTVVMIKNLIKMKPTNLSNTKEKEKMNNTVSA